MFFRATVRELIIGSCLPFSTQSSALALKNAKFKDLTPNYVLIGIELFKASLLFRNVLGLMGKKIN